MKSSMLLLFGGALILFLFFFQLLPNTKEKNPETVSTQTPTLAAPLLRATDPRKGNPGAPIVMFEFGDFACPACKQFQPTIAAVLKKFPNTVLHVWKDFPLPIHPNARAAHVAAECANNQEKFWEYHDRLFAETALTEDVYDRIAQTLGLDMTQFTECRKSDRIKTQVQESFNEALLLAVDKTPYLFINNERLSGDIDAQTLEQTLTRLIQK